LNSGTADLQKGAERSVYRIMSENNEKLLQSTDEKAQEDIQRVKLPARVRGFWKVVFIAFTLTAVVISINQIFNLELLGIRLLSNQYLYLLLALLAPLNFIHTPAIKKANQNFVPWYDALLFLMSFSAFIYLVWYSEPIRLYGWAYLGGPMITGVSLFIILALLEVVRRSRNFALLAVTGVFALYPLIADRLPMIISGHPYGFWNMIRLYVMEEISIIGVPCQVFGSLIIGFLIFGVALEATGGGKFFMNLAAALMGFTRGGTAKMATLASAFFGSLSGTVVANIITTGVLTIPTMRRGGYRADEAAAIECCASTGGVLMPPVMGVAAFVMASYLGLPYLSIVAAALVPSILYYYSLLVQIDFTAARRGIKGLPRKELPSLKDTLLDGWIYIVGIVVLLYVLISLRIESWSPFFATLVILLVIMARKKTRLPWRDIVWMFIRLGQVLSNISTLLATVGIIIGAVFLTGVGISFAREIVYLAGGNVVLVLLLVAAASLFMGMGLPAVAAYLILAIVVGSALERLGINRIAAHLFILYWGMFSFITPPMAIGAYVAAPIAEENPMKVALTAMRFAMIIYFLPFFFVFNPVMILQDFSVFSFIGVFVTALIGVTALGGALTGYIFVLGPTYGGMWGFSARLLLGLGGFMMVVPFYQVSLAGAAIMAVALYFWYLAVRAHKSREVLLVETS
jgi:TRAP transporter 4TM/12TM fusion protein